MSGLESLFRDAALRGQPTQRYGINVDGREIEVDLPLHPSQLDADTLNEAIHQSLTNQPQQGIDETGARIPPLRDEYGRVYPHHYDASGRFNPVREYLPEDMRGLRSLFK